MSSSPSPELNAWRAPVRAVGLDARVDLPGSKSLTNRALILAALADGPSVLRRPLRAGDTELMVGALRALGVRIDDDRADWGVVPYALAGPARVDCGLAGTVLRFVPPIAGLATDEVSFVAAQRARSRPMAPMLQALNDLGVDLEAGRPPALFTVKGTGSVRGGAVTLDASASSQLVSGLLLAGACFDRGVDIRHSGPPVPSLPHVAMTVQALRSRGVDVDDGEGDRWRVAPGPITAGSVTIEPDVSSAAPFLAAALVCGGRVRVPGWPRVTVQAGDRLLEILALLGAAVQVDDSGCTVTGSGSVSGAELDLHDVGELTPVLTALCALADSPSRIRGVAHLRGHESDRLAALAAEINGLGGDVTQTADGLAVRPAPLRGGEFHTHADHRLAQAAAVLGLRVEGISVDDISCVAKTFPEFADAWTALVS